MKNTLNVILITCLSLFGCKTNETVKKSKSENQKGCSEILSTKDLENREIGAVRIQKATYLNNEIQLQLEYSGCGNEELYMAWSGAYMKSLPAKVSLTPGVFYGEARCRALITKNVCFNVENIIDPMRKNGIIFLIEGHDEPITVEGQK